MNLRTIRSLHKKKSRGDGNPTSTTPSPNEEEVSPTPLQVAKPDENDQHQDQQQQHTIPPKQTPTPIIYSYMVTVPEGITPGMEFQAVIEGQPMIVTCPPTVRAGMNLRLVMPAQYNPAASSQDHCNLNEQCPVSTPSRSPRMPRVFEVMVPKGVQSNHRFSIMADGRKLTLACPPNLGPGRKMRFQLPVCSTERIASNGR